MSNYQPFPYYQLTINFASIFLLLLMESPVIAATTVNNCDGETVISNAPQVDIYDAVYTINLARDNAGVPPLKLSEKLTQAALSHVQDMATDNYYKNDTYNRIDGQLIKMCGRDTRIKSYIPNAIAIGEIRNEGFFSYPAGRAVVESWMSSQATSRDIVDPAYWEIGLAVDMSRIFHMWTADFAREQDHYPLIINMENYKTDNDRVELYLYGEWEEVRFQVNGSAWTPWTPFRNEMSGSISAIPAGEIKLTAEMRSGDRSTISHDTIFRLPRENETAIIERPSQAASNNGSDVVMRAPLSVQLMSNRVITVSLPIYLSLIGMLLMTCMTASYHHYRK